MRGATFHDKTSGVRGSRWSGAQSVPRSEGFDVRGSPVRTLVDGRREAGVHRMRWDGMDQRGVQVSSGVYFYRLITGSFKDTKKMVLLR
jgi:flagellar hook assembly protein FlgD